MSSALARWPRTWVRLCGWTTAIFWPAPIRWRPAMVMVSSACWPASSLSLLSSAARSWLPGWYCLTGSFTGTGVLETASFTIAPGVRVVCLTDTRIVARLLGFLVRAGLFGQVGQFLRGVPAEFVAFGPVHGELGVLVARVGRGQRVGGRAHVGAGVGVVRVRRDQQLDRDGGGDQHPAGFVVAGVELGLLGRDLGGQHHPPGRGGRVVRQQPQAGPGGRGQRGVLQFLLVAARVRLAQRGRDGVSGQRTWVRGRAGVGVGTDLAGPEGLGQGRERRRQEHAHGVPESATAPGLQLSALSPEAAFPCGWSSAGGLASAAGPALVTGLASAAGLVLAVASAVVRAVTTVATASSTGTCSHSL